MNPRYDHPQEGTIRPDSLAVIRDAADNGGTTAMPAEDPHGLVADLRYNALAATRLDPQDHSMLEVTLTGEGRRVLDVLDAARK